MINTPKHLAYVLKVAQNEFVPITSSIDNFYYEKEEIKTDKNGQPKLDKNGLPRKRILNPSISRLKQIQKRIQRNILLKLELPDYAYGAVKGRDNVKNAKRHQGKKYIFTTDLRDFFPSINNDRVFQMYRSFNFSPTVSHILTKLTTYKGRLPQGAPTSSSIANLVFIKTGKQLEQFALENKITFTSFIDDLTFSAPFDFKDSARYIIDTIQKDGFRISHNKTNYKTKNPLVTGVLVKNNSLDLPDSFKIKLKEVEGKTPEQIKGLQLYAEKVLRSNK
jgi:RNA-directed DNA polymerase